jgi:hypothetical protein
VPAVRKAQTVGHRRLQVRYRPSPSLAACEGGRLQASRGTHPAAWAGRGHASSAFGRTASGVSALRVPFRASKGIRCGQHQQMLTELGTDPDNQTELTWSWAMWSNRHSESPRRPSSVRPSSSSSRAGREPMSRVWTRPGCAVGSIQMRASDAPRHLGGATRLWR